MGLMAMKGEQLFALLAQMKTPACLNPGFSFGKEFMPEEIAALADGSIFGGEQRVIQRETQVLLGQPARHPDELVVALRERLRRHAVADLAWVAQMHDPGSGESPHLLVALSCPGASPEAYRAVVEDVGAAIGGLAPDGGPVDLIRCDGGAAMGGYFAGIAPVYRRTPAI